MPERIGVPASERLLPLDWLRGLVMMLMALDHVDAATNPHHAQGDSAVWRDGRELSGPDFLTRWCTHLCAPTFLLLCGVGIALSRARSMERDESDRAFDRHLLRRGLVLGALLEVTLVSFYWRAGEGIGSGQPMLPVFLQVLYALGGGMMLMVPLRALSQRSQVLLATVILLGVEVVHGLTLARGLATPFLLQLLATGGMWGSTTSGTSPAGFGQSFDLFILYPVLAWLPVMLLGHVLGQAFSQRRVTTRTLLTLAFWSFVLFAALRWLDGFGNMALHRRSGELLEWLHCSKYPPSITYLAMELGLAFLILAGLLRAQDLLVRLPKWNPIEVLGQTALFFYLLHLPMIGALLAIGVLPGDHSGSAAQSWLGALFVVLACWPLCAGYRWYKQRWHAAWTRYL